MGNNSDQLDAITKMYQYLNEITYLDLSLKETWSDISSDIIEFLQSPHLIDFINKNTDVKNIIDLPIYKSIKHEFLKESKFIKNCVLFFNMNDDVLSDEDKQNALDFFFGSELVKF